MSAAAHTAPAGTPAATDADSVSPLAGVAVLFALSRGRAGH